jgi:hypothetical protein
MAQAINVQIDRNIDQLTRFVDVEFFRQKPTSTAAYLPTDRRLISATLQLSQMTGRAIQAAAAYVSREPNRIIMVVTSRSKDRECGCLSLNQLRRV